MLALLKVMNKPKVFWAYNSSVFNLCCDLIYIRFFTVNRNRIINGWQHSFY